MDFTKWIINEIISILLLVFTNHNFNLLRQSILAIEKHFISSAFVCCLKQIENTIHLSKNIKLTKDYKIVRRKNH